MRRSRRYLVAAAAVGAAVAAVVATSSAFGATPRVGTFTASLSPINGGATGSVELSLRGSQLTVHLTSSGLDGGVHVAHIHGTKHVQSTCPTPAADTDGNGVIDFNEGVSFYGPVARTLSDGMNDTGATLDYTRTFTQLDNGDGIASLGPLEGYAIVVHGVDLDGDGVVSNTDVDGNGMPDPVGNEITTPALCAVIQAD